MASNNQGNKQSGQGASQGGGTKNRGFASMDPARQREIASEGGKAAHQKGTAHEFTSEEARRAGSMSHGNRQSAQSAQSAQSGAGTASTARGSVNAGAGAQAEQGTDNAGNKSGSAGTSKKSP